MLGLAAMVVILILLVQRAESYYAGPVYPVLLAAGAVSFERFLNRQASPRRRRRKIRAMIAALAISSVLAVPFALPVLPVHQMVRYHLDGLRTDYAAMIGWPELVGTVATVTNDAGAANEERGRPIFLCRDLRTQPDSWPALRGFVS